VTTTCPTCNHPHRRGSDSCPDSGLAILVVAIICLALGAVLACGL
jgi:hypothetical protein